MATNLSLAAGLLNASTLWRSNWQDISNTAYPGPFKAWTEVIPGAGAARVDINWVTNHPVMQKWLGARQYKGMRHYNTTIAWEAYEATFKIARGTLEYDLTGAVERGIKNFQASNVSAQDKSVATAFDSASGAGPTGFDAVALFSASHPHGPAGATQSNLAATTNLNHANLRAAEAAGALIVGENGEPADVVYSILRVGPKLKRRAQELTSADRVQTIAGDQSQDSGTAVAAATRSNVYAGALNVIVDPRVTNFFWTLIDDHKSAKPMVLFEARAPIAVSRTTLEDSYRFEHDEFLYGLEGDWGIGAGHWHTCYRGTGTA